MSCPRVCSTDYVNDKLYVPIALFPQLVQEDIVLTEKVYFFVHFHGAFNVKRKQIVNNFGVLYYESISSPFLLYKTYLEILCTIVYNFVEKKILPLFIIMVSVRVVVELSVTEGYVRVAVKIRTSLLFIVKRQLFASELLRFLVCF